MSKSESSSSFASARTIVSSTKGVQRLYTKIRHKIGDNLTPKIVGKGSKDNAKSNSASAISAPVDERDIVSTVPSGEPTTGFRRTQGMLKHQRIVNKTKIQSRKNVSTAQLYRKDKGLDVPSASTTPAKSTKCIYVDSDDEYQLNFKVQSLEDEIFEELEKAAHDETKLNAVLQNFDSILSEYNSSNSINAIGKDRPNLLPVASVEPLITIKPPTNYIPPPIEFQEGIVNIENTCVISKPLKSRTWKSCTVLQPLSSIRTNSNRTRRSKSLYNLNEFNKKTNHSEILQGLKTQVGERICNEGNNARKMCTRLRSKSTWELTNSLSSSKIPVKKRTPSLKLRSNSLCDITDKSHENSENIISEIKEPASTTMSHKNILQPKTLKILNQKRQAQLLPVKMKQNPPNQIKISSNYETNNYNRECLRTESLLYSKIKENSDVLLDKCLEKGHAILRKVEAMQAEVTINGKRTNKHVKHISSHRKGSGAKKVEYLRSKRQLLKYADDMKVDQPKLESCRIIPPIIGETSAENAKLLVNVVQIKPSLLEITTKPVDCHKSFKIEKTPLDSDSDDSGHISIDNCDDCSGNLLANNDSPSGGKSIKIANLLKKFENPTDSQTPPRQIQIGKKSCMSVKMAEVDAVKCIQTQVEIYPTYSKEVTIRLL